MASQNFLNNVLNKKKIETDNVVDDLDADAPVEKKEAVKAKKNPTKKAEKSVSDFIGADAAGFDDKTSKLIPLELIDVYDQVRKTFDQDYIEDLAVDFRNSESKQPMKPITVYSNGERYILETGENRYRAQKLNQTIDPLAFSYIRATVVAEYDESKRLEKMQRQIKENGLVKGNNAAELYLALKEYKKENPELTQLELAKWCGFDNLSSGRTKVVNALSLESYPREIFNALLEGEITFNKAKQLKKEFDKKTGVNSISEEIEINEDEIINIDNGSDNVDDIELTAAEIKANKAKQKKSEQAKIEKTADAMLDIGGKISRSKQDGMKLTFEEIGKFFEIINHFAEKMDLDFVEVNTRSKKDIESFLTKELDTLIEEMEVNK
jgi:hypothetical protein